MIKELMLKTLILEGVKGIRKILSSKGLELIITKDNLESAIYAHNNFIINSTNYVSFKEMRGNKFLNEIYINLDIELQPKRYKSKEDNSPKYSINEIIDDSNNHIVILGGPGAGKTTTVRNVCQTLLTGNIKDYSFPVLVNLKDLSDDEGIFIKLKNILGIELYAKEKTTQTAHYLEDKALTERYINSYLNDLNVIVILDGLDEVKPSRLNHFYREIQSLMLNLSSSLIILTCRSASYNYNLENSIEYELCNLTETQVKEFVTNWFSDSRLSNTFLKKLSKSKFYDLSLKPLTLAHLCAIYDKTGKFYDKPKSIYKKLVRILIEEWDEQRGILRESKYSEFDNEVKFDFLCHLSFDLTINISQKIYDEEDLIDSYKRIHKYFNLPQKDCIKIIKEIEEHNGIIIKSSYDSFEFVHKSMQEYLTAEYIVKMPSIPIKLFYDVNISNELAISVSLSSDSNLYYYNLVFDCFNPNNISKQFIIEFLSRLSYEKPLFNESLLIPYSFIYIFSILLDNHEIYDSSGVDFEFQSRFFNIIKDFKTYPSIKKSFLSLQFYISPNFDEVEEIVELRFDEEMTNNLSENESYFFDYTNELRITKSLFDEHFNK